MSDIERRAWRSRNPLSIGSCHGSSVCHPEVARLTLFNLELDRPRPHLVLTLNAVQDATVAGLPGALSKGALAPLELGPQIKAAERLLRNQIAHLVAGDVDHPVLHAKDMVRITVEPAAAKKRVKP